MNISVCCRYLKWFRMEVSMKYRDCSFKMVKILEVKIRNGLVVIVKIVGILLKVNMILVVFIIISVMNNGVVVVICLCLIKNCFLLNFLVMGISWFIYLINGFWCG